LSSRPFPLPQDVHAPPGVYLYRAAAAYLRAGADRSGRLSPESATKQLFGDGDAPTMAMVRRAASGPATTSGVGWADALAALSVFDAVAAPTTLAASATLIANALHVNLDGFAQVVIPTRTVNADAAGQWVGEAGAKPVRGLHFDSLVLEPRKLSVVSVFTREMSESSNIENVVRQTLSESAGLALDAALLSPFGADPTRPAGLLNGVVSFPPSAGGGQTAMITDLGTLVAALSEWGGGLNPAFVCAPRQATAMQILVGPHFTAPILPSAALANGTVIAIETGSLVVGFDSKPEFHVSGAGTLHMEDTTPAATTLGAPTTRSMYQTDSLALKMTVRAAWGLRAPGHAAWIQNATWP
jgi:hypothetical protein